MNQKRSDLLTISTFASSTRLSVKALRLYDQLEILKPLYIDPLTGYRYYQLEQIHTARLIRMMRLMDMPLALIRQVLSGSSDEAEQLVNAYLDDLRTRVEQASHMVQSLIHTLKGEHVSMPFEISVKTVQSQHIVSITRRVKVSELDDTIRDSINQLKAVVDVKGVIAGVPFGIYHGHIDHESDGPIEVCLPTEVPLTDVGSDLQIRELPASKVVSVSLHGQECDFPDILKGYDALVDWMRQNGYEQAESPHEIWHDTDHMEITWAFQEKNH